MQILEFVLPVPERGDDNMHLAILVVDLIIIAVLWIKDKFQKPSPPIDNLDEHIKHLTSLHNQKARQKYLKNRKFGDK